MKLFHNHKWEIRQSRRVDHYAQYVAHLSDMPYKTTTEILYECAECGKLKTKTMKGKWDL